MKYEIGQLWEDNTTHRLFLITRVLLGHLEVTFNGYDDIAMSWDMVAKHYHLIEDISIYEAIVMTDMYISRSDAGKPYVQVEPLRVEKITQLLLEYKDRLAIHVWSKNITTNQKSLCIRFGKLLKGVMKSRIDLHLECLEYLQLPTIDTLFDEDMEEIVQGLVVQVHQLYLIPMTKLQTHDARAPLVEFMNVYIAEVKANASERIEQFKTVCEREL